MGYGPDLTRKQKAKLEAEIRAFNKDKTLRDIEKNAVGDKDESPYWNWVTRENFGYEPAVANQDSILAPDSLELSVGRIDWQMLDAKMEINESLSHRQKQVWQLCMRQGKSVEAASEQLNLKASTVASYLKDAKEKVKRHFKKES